MMKSAIFARELGVPIVMHDYLTGGFTANRVALEVCVQAHNEGRDLAREDNEIKWYFFLNNYI